MERSPRQRNSSAAGGGVRFTKVDPFDPVSAGDEVLMRWHDWVEGFYLAVRSADKQPVGAQLANMILDNAGPEVVAIAKDTALPPFREAIDEATCVEELLQGLGEYFK
jgi:hypothetical protein